MPLSHLVLFEHLQFILSSVSMLQPLHLFSFVHLRYNLAAVLIISCPPWVCCGIVAGGGFLACWGNLFFPSVFGAFMFLSAILLDHLVLDLLSSQLLRVGPQ